MLVSDLEPLKVLIVDDDAFMRKTIRAMLRLVGRFIAEEADDGDTNYNGDAPPYV